MAQNLNNQCIDEQCPLHGLDRCVCCKCYHLEYDCLLHRIADEQDNHENSAHNLYNGCGRLFCQFLNENLKCINDTSSDDGGNDGGNDDDDGDDGGVDDISETDDEEGTPVIFNTGAGDVHLQLAVKSGGVYKYVDEDGNVSNQRYCFAVDKIDFNKLTSLQKRYFSRVWRRYTELEKIKFKPLQTFFNNLRN